ncbi:MAG: redoxin family protein [Saprospiraceae bacterium]|jgi:thioredoxin-related protein|uniref:redoxin family protein n=1 Tax=Candidatus Brachybacter algidus TaxID=2982024 RepID=UPI001B4DC507|nr:redoxin family protein [Candidatus Brachybacter algidus]MBP7304619.1 redoxin family protein [Saprospiraceae bacterium]MBK6372712.1 redoxin family protein [Candidatus Brachybacter algidus]MBK6448317.1 redoxin family protein [Candidatus Brachybacter algidus]MBK7605540.1 redoxin family protein [Candidatus Brachybacter algidus]MBK8354195.1 redoxin family protein [Candidatus Brachybacter algidus]
MYNLLVFILLLTFPVTNSSSISTVDHKAPIEELSAYLFLSETCPICISLTPEIKKIEAEFLNKGLVLHLVFPNVKDSNPEKIGKFVRKYHLKSQAFIDNEQSLTNKYGASTTPEVFLVEKKTDRIIYSGKVNDEFIALGKRKRTNINHFLYDAIRKYLEGDKSTVISTKAVGCFIIKEID